MKLEERHERKKQERRERKEKEREEKRKRKLMQLEMVGESAKDKDKDNDKEKEKERKERKEKKDSKSGSLKSNISSSQGKELSPVAFDGVNGAKSPSKRKTSGGLVLFSFFSPSFFPSFPSFLLLSFHFLSLSFRSFSFLSPFFPLSSPRNSKIKIVRC